MKKKFTSIIIGYVFTLITVQALAGAGIVAEDIEPTTVILAGKPVYLCLHGAERAIVAKKEKKGYWFKGGHPQPGIPHRALDFNGDTYHLYPAGYTFPRNKCPGEWVLPGGKSTGGSLQDEVLREFKEETGYDLDLTDTGLSAKKFEGGEFYALYVNVADLSEDDPRRDCRGPINITLENKHKHIEDIITCWNERGNLDGFVFNPPVKDDELSMVGGHSFGDIKAEFDSDVVRRGWYSIIISQLMDT